APFARSATSEEAGAVADDSDADGSTSRGFSSGGKASSLLITDRAPLLENNRGVWHLLLEALREGKSVDPVWERWIRRQNVVREGVAPEEGLRVVTTWPHDGNRRDCCGEGQERLRVVEQHDALLRDGSGDGTVAGG